MTLLIKHIAQKAAIRKNKSDVKTGFVPLDKVKRAFVLMNEAEIGGVPTEEEIKAYFKNQGIDVTVIRPSSKDINWIGRIRRKVRFPGGEDIKEDLFISLYGQSSFESDYEAICSRAAFKVGRYYLKGDIFDLMLSNPPKRDLTQIEAFRAITDILTKVK